MTEATAGARTVGSDSRHRTIVRLWDEAVTAARRNPAYLVEDSGGWREVSWREADEAIRDYANGLLASGIRRGDMFGLLARNSLEWALLDFALARIGAVSVPIYASSSAADVGNLLRHSEAVGVVCEDAEQLAKVELERSVLPN